MSKTVVVLSTVVVAAAAYVGYQKYTESKDEEEKKE